MTDGVTDAVAKAWSAEEFGAAAAEWQRLLTDHLRDVMAGRTKVLNWSEPQPLMEAAEASARIGRPGAARTPRKNLHLCSFAGRSENRSRKSAGRQRICHSGHLRWSHLSAYCSH